MICGQASCSGIFGEDGERIGSLMINSVPCSGTELTSIVPPYPFRNDIITERQAQACPFTRGLGGKKRLEDFIFYAVSMPAPLSFTEISIHPSDSFSAAKNWYLPSPLVDRLPIPT